MTFSFFIILAYIHILLSCTCQHVQQMLEYCWRMYGRKNGREKEVGDLQVPWERLFALDRGFIKDSRLAFPIGFNVDYSYKSTPRIFCLWLGWKNPSRWQDESQLVWMIINDADTAHRVRKRSHVMLFPRDCLVMPVHSDHGMWWCLSSVLAHVILACYVYYMHAHKSSKYKTQPFKHTQVRSECR